MAVVALGICGEFPKNQLYVTFLLFIADRVLNEQENSYVEPCNFSKKHSLPLCITPTMCFYRTRNGNEHCS